MLLHGRHDGLRESEMEGVGPARKSRGAEQLAVVDGSYSPEGIGYRAVDVLGYPAVVFVPARFQRDRVVLEVVQHARDCVEEEVLDTAAGRVQHDAEVFCTAMVVEG